MDDWTLEMTCSACPEQYDLVDSLGNDKAYFRLRWGHFVVRCPDVSAGIDGVALEYEWLGDHLKGCFDSEEERKYFLNLGIEKAKEWWAARQ